MTYGITNQTLEQGAPGPIGSGVETPGSLYAKWETCGESIGVNMEEVILCAMLAGIINSSYAAETDQENVVDYSKLIDYPA